jgi:predicted alpha-1,6-mannanase (GH76 family)
LLRLLLFCGFVAFGVNWASGAEPAPTQTVAGQLERATNGINTLQGWFNQSTGLYETTGWWNSANAITVLVDYSKVSGSMKYKPVFENALTSAQSGERGSKGFLNNFYDDEGWWALAWIDAYDLTGDPQYLSIAESIFSDITTGWDEVCGGGVWWSKDRQYKGAIENELFLSVAAHLANRDRANRVQYLGWANKEWRWFIHSGLINHQNLVNDGLGTPNSKTPSHSCSNNGLTTWTYNQGVVLGGLAELSRLDPDPSLPRTAQKIATAAISVLVDSSGVLHESCEPKCGADGVQFKGIFVRNLAALNAAYPRATYKTFIQTNANAIWDASRGPNFQFGQVWSGPFDITNAGIQSAALDAILAAAELQSPKLRYRPHQMDSHAASMDISMR